MNQLFEKRGISLAIGAGVAVVLIAVLALALKAGSKPAVLLLDLQDGPQTFPFPLTIQNLMLVLFGLGIGDVLHRRARAAREEASARRGYLPEDERTVLVPEDLKDIRLKIRDGLAPDSPYLQRVIDACIQHYQANRSSEEAHQILTTSLDFEMHRSDLRFTLLRYLAWTIPTIGFIGTVVGIAGALSVLSGEAGTAMSAKMDEVIANLALAFNTTIMALCLSAVLVLLIQFTQKREEEAINSSSSYCLRNLVSRLFIPPQAKGR